ncbi:hypothetical protein LSPH24S_09101 [Lysinibacillus sphaericus]
MQKLTGEERSYYIENFQIEDFFCLIFILI